MLKRNIVDFIERFFIFMLKIKMISYRVALLIIFYYFSK